MTLSTAMNRDDAALMTPAFCAAEYSLVAAAATDNVEQTGAYLDLVERFGTTRFGSLTAVLAATAVLGAAATLTLKGVHFEHSDDNVTYVDVEPPITRLTLSGPAGGGAVTGATLIGCNLAEAKRYVRLRYTPDLSAGSNDTARVSTSYLLTGPTAL